MTGEFRPQRLAEGTGDAHPFRRAPRASRAGESASDVGAAFAGLENPAGGLPGPTPSGPPYTVKDGYAKHAVSPEWVEKKVRDHLAANIQTVDPARWDRFRNNAVLGEIRRGYVSADDRLARLYGAAAAAAQSELAEPLFRRPDAQAYFNSSRAREALDGFHREAERMLRGVLVQAKSPLVTGEAASAARRFALRPKHVAGLLGGAALAGGGYALYRRLREGASDLHGVKTAWHAHTRMEERTPFHRSHVELIQRAVDTLALPGASYHLPLRAKDGTLAGYAQFKRVPDRKTPVLATVLAPHMRPGGENIEALLKAAGAPETNVPAAASAPFTTDRLDPRPPESRAWDRRHRHVGAPEPGDYAHRRAFDGVDTTPRDEVIEAPVEDP